MRLICPECNAAYEVPAQMIPPEGREVECSACGHVWQQMQDAPGVSEEYPEDARTADPRQGGETPATLPGPTSRGLSEDLRAEARRHNAAAAPVELGAAPALQRPLPDDVLSILREETARELSARRAEKPVGEVADKAPEAKPAEELPVADKPDPDRAPAVAEAKQVAAADDAPASTGGDPQPQLAVTRPSYGDWPATTVTEPDDSEPRIISRGRKAQQESVPAPESGPVLVPIPAVAPKRALSEDALVVPASDSVSEPAANPAPRREARTLPDADRLAATARTGPEKHATPTPATPPDTHAERETSQGGYRAGMFTALLSAAALCVLYIACTAWVRSGDAPESVEQIVLGIDGLRGGLRNLIGGDG